MYRTADVQYSCMGAYMLVSMVPYLVVNTPSKAGARDSVSERRRDFISRFDFFALIPAHCTLGHLRVWALLRLRATSSEEERAVQRDCATASHTAALRLTAASGCDDALPPARRHFGAELKTSATNAARCASSTITR